MSVVRPVLLHRVSLLAFKSALAAGLAWRLGSLLPGEIGEYAYYASLGAISVVYPAVSDSVRESLRATAAILIGAVLASVMQLIAWPNSVTVGLIVLVGVVLSHLPGLGEQRHWVPTAALFVLVFSGDPPHEYVLVYTGQILLGAAVGIGVSALVPALNLTALHQSVEDLRQVLVRQLTGAAGLLRDGNDLDPDDLGVAFEEIEQERMDLRGALEQVQRSRQGNPRARRHEASWQELSDRAHGLARIGFLLQDVDIVIQDARQEGFEVFDDGLRTATARAFSDLAALIEHPGPDRVERARSSVADLARGVEASSFESAEARHLAGVLAASAQLALITVKTRLVHLDVEVE